MPACKTLRNKYYLCDQDRFIEITLKDPENFQWGIKFYLDIFCHIEEHSRLEGLTFYLSGPSPKNLPKYGKDVVLVLVSDEHYRYRHYWPDLLAIIRTYPSWPKYLDGLPTSWRRLISFIHYYYKLFMSCRSFVKALLIRKDLALFFLSKQILHTPLGFFSRFDPQVKPTNERTIDYAFLGSLRFNKKNEKKLHKILDSPKIISRRLMIQALMSISTKKYFKGLLKTTSDFEESILEPEQYINALENCKISICPRGTNSETYRFFESCAAGCVVISEPLPEAWFYLGNPAITIRDWKRLPEILDSLLTDPQLLQKLSKKTRAFWLKKCSEKAVADKVISFLEDLCARPPGAQTRREEDIPPGSLRTLRGAGGSADR